jgi:hypothetical protein
MSSRRSENVLYHFIVLPGPLYHRESNTQRRTKRVYSFIYYVSLTKKVTKMS